ncbi:hypothetical protein [Paenibacillus brasilensis]|uniref:Uncharacterized protein n=1 Tax=Paenibacillus brasilensis TaxID=128574 RepID=A0ABU0KZF7_9BACL|nr:hypothetical protein [Paenibacillus brasilensis]MDQ0494827.1 hypothetical protein [Paenibacillus brasilensis]
MEYMDEQILALMNSLKQEKLSVSIKDWSTISLQMLIHLDGETVSLTERLLLNERISMTMPKTFKKMEEEDALLKYPSCHRPGLIFANNTGTTNLTFNHTSSELLESEMELFKNEMVHILKNTERLMEWYGDGIIRIQNQLAGYCEFITPTLSTPVYNLACFVTLEERALIITFNCMEEEVKLWRPIAKGLMGSLVIQAKREGELI